MISAAILPAVVTQLGNTTTGSGTTIVLSVSPSLTTPSVGGAGMTFTGSISGSTILKASAAAGGTLLLPNVSGTLITSGDIGTITPGMISPTTGSGSVVLSNGATLSNVTIAGFLRFAVPPQGTPTAYACFDGDNKLISYPFRCR